ncbi:hypothetical protein B7463_g11164, partial [Scytalidium lignicola]
MLIGRIRVLVKKTTEQDATIDEYHDQEVSLRKQLGARVDAFNDLQKELELTTSAVEGLKEELGEKEVGNQRLSSALDGYRNEVSNLEKLIQTMEKEFREMEARLKEEVQTTGDRLQDELLAHETTRADNEGKEILIAELERRLAAAVAAGDILKSEMENLSALTSTKIATQEDTILFQQSTIDDLNSQFLEQEKTYGATIAELKSRSMERESAHGAALALRDAQVLELRTEIERVNEALMTAHEAIQSLRKDNEQLKGQVDGEKMKGLHVVRAMRDQLNLVLAAGNGYLEENTAPIVQKSADTDDEEESGLEHNGAVRKGHFMNGKLARKSGGKRRRYDSGLGFLEEEEAEMQDLMTDS